MTDAAEAQRITRFVVAEARMAAVYQGFLENIEPAERVYHEEDPIRCLRQLAAML